MIGELSSDQIDMVLYTHVVGRIGCRQNNKIYVVPITYAYDGAFLYMHSQEGLKIEIMRKNPEVCFEVDVMENMVCWRSVIIWGTYEELKKESAQQKALKKMSDILTPLLHSETLQRPHPSDAPPTMGEKKPKPVVFRIKVREKTGRYEKPYWQ